MERGDSWALLAMHLGCPTSRIDPISKKVAPIFWWFIPPINVVKLGIVDVFFHKTNMSVLA